MEIIVKALAVGIIGTILCLMIGKSTPELALCLAICTGVTLIAYALAFFSGVIGLVEQIAESAGLSSAVVKPVLKTSAIGILTKLACDICRDAGQGAIASAVELTGVAAALYVALPLMRTVFGMIEELL